MAKGKAMTISINPDEIVGTEIVKSGDYRYASMGIKKGDNEYIRISYEWRGDGNVPEFVMGLMEFLKANKETIYENKEEKATEYTAIKERF